MIRKPVKEPPIKRRGRPPKDNQRANQLAIDLAEALRLAHGLGRQEARDLAIGYLEGDGIDPRSGAGLQIPRGRHQPGSLMVALRLPYVQMKTRSRSVLRMEPRAGVVLALTMLLRGKDEAAIRNCARQLAMMPEQHARRAIALLLEAVAGKPHN
jgi:hypothetical protein